jgi:hypothetical protein
VLCDRSRGIKSGGIEPPRCGSVRGYDPILDELPDRVARLHDGDEIDLG